MNKREKIGLEIEKTFNQFENNDSIEPNPFLYTRIKQEIDGRSRNKLNFGSVLKPAFFAVLVSINMITAIWYLNSNDNVTQANSNQGLVEIFTNDFNLNNYESDLLIVE